MTTTIYLVLVSVCMGVYVGVFVWSYLEGRRITRASPLWGILQDHRKARQLADKLYGPVQRPPLNS